MTAPQNLDDVFATMEGTVGRRRFRVGAEWSQGRSLYGGLIAALGTRAMRSSGVDPRRRLRGLLVTFVGPMAPGEVDVEVETLRSGRSATLVAARVRQGGETLATLEGAFAEDRDSDVELPASPSPGAPAWETLPELPYVPGIVPEFTQRLEYRLAWGAVPYSGVRASEIGGWTRFREGGEASEDYLVALADAWPVPVLSMFTRPGPASSLTWSFDLLAPPSGAATDWYLLRLSTDQAGGGWVHVDMDMWSAGGRLVAKGRQVVAIFDR